jgi:hypothetical protein
MKNIESENVEWEEAGRWKLVFFEAMAFILTVNG